MKAGEKEEGGSGGGEERKKGRKRGKEILNNCFKSEICRADQHAGL